MDLAFTQEEIAFQKEVRDWIAENYSDDLRRRNSLSKTNYLDKEGMVEWQRKLDDKGWFVVNWPEEYGGPGLTAGQRYILNMEMSAAGTPATTPMGKSMVAPVIMAFGNDKQKAEHLPKIKRTDIWWCQGYSEPGSGSDLASLQMSAVRDGDEYVLNGSKIWTTHAQWADWIFCLVRTSKEGKPQEGISFLIFPMDLPGISISPLPTLDGPTENQQEINQVFFEDVRVKIDDALIGEENKGWTYAKYLLQFERGNAYAPGSEKHAGQDQEAGQRRTIQRRAADQGSGFRAQDRRDGNQDRVAERHRVADLLSAGRRAGRWPGKLDAEMCRVRSPTGDHRTLAGSGWRLCRAIRPGHVRGRARRNE